MSSKAEGSIERRLQWLLGGLLLALLAGLLVVGLRLAWTSSLEYVVTRLGHDAEAILAAFDPGTGTFRRPLPGIYQQPLSGHYLLIRLADGREIRSRSLWDESLPLAPLGTGRQRQTRLTGPRDQQLLLWSAGYEKGGLPITLGVAEDISGLHQRFRHLLWLGLGLALAGAALLLLAQKLLLRRLFRRLDRVRRELSEVGSGRRQALDEQVPSEIAPLVGEFNQLLHHLQAHLERARHAAGNLAHALKGPLQLIQQQGRQLGDLRLQQQGQLMQHLIERELHRARIAGSALAGRHFRPDADVGDLLDTLQALYRDKPLGLERQIQAPASLALDQDDMMELAGNLLDNAAKWAAARVTLTLVAEERVMTLSVEDDGPGVTEDALDELQRRGRRLDEQPAGHGLGLAIVADIVEGYGGQLLLDRSPGLGGLRARVRLPLS